MGLINQSVTVTPAQVEELSRKLASMRHDINNHLSLIVAALELIQHKPELRERMLTTVGDQTPKILDQVGRFCEEFDRFFGIPKS